MTQIGIGIIPPEDYSLFVRKQEIYLSKKYNTIVGLLQPPHVTIKWPFEINDIQPFEKYCEDLSKEIQPFEIKINGYGFFDPKVIFLKVEKNQNLINIHLKILKDLKEKFEIEKNKYEGAEPQFHTTLAYEDISEENFHKAKKELKKAEQPKLSFIFDSLGLFRFTGEEWIIHKNYNIQA